MLPISQARVLGLEPIAPEAANTTACTNALKGGRGRWERTRRRPTRKGVPRSQMVSRLPRRPARQPSRPAASVSRLLMPQPAAHELHLCINTPSVSAVAQVCMLLSRGFPDCMPCHAGKAAAKSAAGDGGEEDEAEVDVAPTFDEDEGAGDADTPRAGAPALHTSCTGRFSALPGHVFVCVTGRFERRACES